jgi:hypothetical protein
MSNDNPTWGAPRIHGELLKLGFVVCERSVSRYLSRIKYEPPENKINKWMTFITNQGKGIAAMDFFVVPTLFFKRLIGDKRTQEESKKDREKVEPG